MYRNFILATMVSVIPFSQKVSENKHLFTRCDDIQLNIFSYKSSFPSLLIENPGKSSGPYSQNWLTAAQENIRKSEYNFKWEEKFNAYCTPNRKNNLHFFYTEKGFSVEPGTTQIPIGDVDPGKKPDKIEYQSIPSWKVNFQLDKKHLSKGTWKVDENKAEYITNNITAQYINNDEGMRQNFIVHKPLAKGSDLKINFSIKTTLETVLKNNRLEFLHKKKTVLQYKDLKVWDADGKALAATIRKNKREQYSIVVKTTGAVYPITVDPISTTPAASVQSNNAEARMGSSISSAGDVNGDGYSDVIVGAYFYNNGQAGEGAFYVYHGSATGMNTTPALMLESNQVGWQMGLSVSTAGDVNGDGYSDIIVGAPLYSNGESSEGAFLVYHGSASGINSIPVTFVESNLSGSCRLGFSVSTAGDVNGDGYSDVIVGANGYGNGQTLEGAMYVYMGSATGINTASLVIVETNVASAQFGWSVAPAGDVNGDGYGDVIAGASRFSNGQSFEGAFYVFHGSAAGISTTPAASVESNLASAFLGTSVDGAGDVNGDGYSDVIVGANSYANGESGEGAAFIYYGSGTGISTTPATSLESNSVNAFMGNSVACIGDANADGYSDIAVGVEGYSNGEANEGAVFIYFGASAGISITPTAIIESNQAAANMGSVSSAGDVNGDGYSDVVAGASQYTDGELREGAVFLYHGSAAGVNPTPNTTAESNVANTYLGSSVASAGDVNGDGYGDIVLGAYRYSNGQTNEGALYVYYGSATGISTTPAAILQSNRANSLLGFSVAFAGDVNGDGYSDIVGGASNYTNGQANEGAAYLYYGSSSGMITTPVILESDQAGAQMGVSVASAGDVNGDGYSDLVVGAENYDNGQTDEGAAFIYLGSATGINTTVATIAEGNIANANLGYSVSSAGDVNGDGYSDVIAGGPFYANGQTDEGAFYVYQGSATGIPATPSAIMESNLSSAQLGFSIAGAGDVNGDGYSDVIVGANNYSNGQGAEGAAFIYHGSAAGIISTPIIILEIDHAAAYMGRAVAGAGDVNGDGYSDVVAGAYGYENGGQTDEGAAFIYYGSVTGISGTPAVLESNQGGALAASAVAGAGDVNGDGYSDVISGALFYTNGQSREGCGYIYHGNSPGLGKRNNLRLYNNDLTTPINSSNFVFGNFGAGLYARSFWGRAKGKMVWEARLNYNAYSGTPITNSTLFTAQQAVYTNLGLNGIELKDVITKLLGGRYTKLRARIKFDPATAITGQVYSPWRNVSSVIDANNLGILPIELISFKAAWIQKGKTARLDFKTDKENGICCFDVEKSADGFNFFSIGILPAKNISGIQSYSFIDGNATGKKQFYRIKIKGIAGQIDYSNIQHLQNDKVTEILVFPNPTTDVLQLKLNKAYDKMDVQIINSAGQMVKQLIIPASNQIMTIPVRDLAPGKYWLHLQSGDDMQVLQFLRL